MSNPGAAGRGPRPRHSLPQGPTTGGNMDYGAKRWGHQFLLPPQPNMLRIGGLNINGFPVEECKAGRQCGCKNCRLRFFIRSNRFDMIGISECNLHWPSLPIEAQLPERTRGWFESLHRTTSFLQRNRSYPTPTQFGGTSVWSIGKTAHKVERSGYDNSGLGRWAWTLCNGTSDIKLRVISAYCPVENKTGPSSVWNQQRSKLHSLDDDRNPIRAFSDDLATEIGKWLEEGNQIVLTADTNADVRSSYLSQKLRSIGLIEIITNTHTQHGGQPPATYRSGSKPIDGIYVSSTLKGSHCGYLDFWADHRCTWIDIPLSVAFGHNIPVIAKPPARRLKTQDPRIVQRYATRYRQFASKHNLYERVNELMQTTTYPCSRATGEEWEKCDQIRVKGMMEAERLCRKLHMGEVDFSPTYQKQEYIIKFWNLLIRKRKRHMVNSRHFIRTAKTAGLLQHRHMPLAEALQQRTAAYTKLRTIKKKATSLRTTWQYQLAEAQAKAGNTTVSAKIKENRTREIQRKQARLIRRVNGKLQSGGLSSVTAPSPEGNLEKCYTKEAIEKACLEENQRRFRQASDTPFMQSPLFEVVGNLGVSEGAKQILNGQLEHITEVDNLTEKFIAQLERPKQVQQESLHHQSFEEYQRGWLKARERTSSGPSGLHFGHFMANAQHEDLATIDYLMEAIPFKTGYSPQRWRKGINVMLPKVKNNDFVGKLRAILLYEADFNHGNKQLGRSMMYTAEDLNLIAPEQYGSRKRHQAIDHGLNKVLTFDLARIRRTPLALCSNDAKSCYDRIVHSVASLCLQRIGVAEAPIVCMFGTIQNLKHYVRTIYGDSTLNFGGDLWLTPVQGVGQGNGAGPPIWALVSTPILNLLREEGCGAFFKTAISGQEISFVGYSFVDDTDLCAASMNAIATGAEIAMEMQRSIDLWAGGLKATGGALVPAKSYWYLLDYRWLPDGSWRYKSIEEAPATLYIPDHTGTRMALERLDVSEAKRTLGVRIAPDGNMKTQCEAMLQVSQDWAAGIRTGHLPRPLAWLSMKTTVIKTLDYPLPATTLTRTQCDKILAPIRRAVLPAAGIVRTFPIKLAMASEGTQGLGIPDLYECQEAYHLDRIIHFAIQPKVITGSLISAMFEQHKMELGLNGPLMSHNFEEIQSIITPTWVSDTWAFVSSIGATLEDDIPDFPRARVNDRCIMEIFLTNKTITLPQLKSLNRCRVYLRAITISDITTGCGSKIQIDDWEGRRNLERNTKYQWPNQGILHQTAWQLWKKALTTSLGLRGTTLSQPLGPYYASEQQCQWFFDPTLDRLYKAENNCWKCFPRIPGRPSRRAIMKFSKDGTPTNRPPSALRATVESRQSFWRLTGYCHALEPTITDNTEQTLQTAIQKLPEAAIWAVQEIEQSDEGAIIAEALTQGTCVGVSDGSFKDELGSASWVFESTAEVGRIVGLVNVPGARSDHSAYRSELGGLFGIVTMVNCICELHKVTKGSMRIMCDGISALNKAVTTTIQFSTSDPQFDLIVAIQRAIQLSPITFQPVHVKGHQDDERPMEQLDRFSLLNIEVDRRAKQYLLVIRDLPRPQNRVYLEPWALWINDEKICGSLVETILERLAANRGKQYWTQRGKMGTATANDVDWETTKIAMKKSTITRRHWISKQSADLNATGKQMVRRGQWSENKCPRCALPEDSEHIWICKDIRARALWQVSLSKLEEWLIAKHTAPDIKTAICSNLKQWIFGEDPILFSTTLPGLQQTIDLQNQLGWRSFLEGRIAIGWADLQDKYFKSKQRRNSGRQWLANFIQEMWKVAWEVWEQRNKILHDHKISRQIQETKDKIRQEFALPRRSYTTDARRLFTPGMESILKYPSTQLFAWLERIQNDRKRKARRRTASQRSLATNRRTMQQWLRRSNPSYNTGN